MRPFVFIWCNRNPPNAPAGHSVAYHDNVAGNAGDAAFRTSEDVDIRTSPGGTGSVVTNFETGEWLTYTINVVAAGAYDIGVKAANNLATASLHVEVDGSNVGTVSVPVINQPISTRFAGSNGNPYLKLGVYHDTIKLQNTSMVHDRLRRGASADAVRMDDFPVDLDAPVTYCPNTGP